MGRSTETSQASRGTELDGWRCRGAMITRRATHLLLALLPSAAGAQGLLTGNVWVPVEHVTSADLAAQGWSVSEAAGLSLESGQAAVVIYWEHTLYNTRRVMRCVASLDAALVETNEICSQPMAGLQSP